jgi:glycerol-3-phosphate dehydrogenase
MNNPGSTVLDFLKTSTVWPEEPPARGAGTLPDTLEVQVGIIGAGIHGASLARELKLRGISCAVIDKGAVGGGTSQWSTKLFHGGIRYLVTGDIHQMREGLAARATWMRIAPHRCKWETFWMPHEGMITGLTHRFGIGLYDFWGSDRPNWPAELRLGGVPRRMFEADPRSKGAGFHGAVAYADCLTWDRDVVKDFIASSDAQVLDFHEVEQWSDEGGKLVSARLRDRRDGSARTVKAAQWVFALGPWTDRVMASWFQEDSHRLRLSAGIHMWLDPIPGCDRPWAMRRPKGRILFVIPRDGMLQIGTTEREVDDGWVPVAESEREELYAGLEDSLPGIKWREIKVHKTELGVRPLMGHSGSTTKLSREAILEQHPRLTNLRLVLGGKLTTARHLMAKLATEMTGTECPASETQPLVRWDGQAVR